MTEPAVTEAAPEAPEVPTDAELADVPPEKDPYFVKQDGTKVTGLKADKGEPANEDKPPEAEPEKAEAKPDEPEEERAPTAKEIANAKRYRKDLAKRERELKRRETEASAKQAEIDRLFALRRDNPRAFLEETGLTFRELAEEAARQDGEDPRDKAIRELREELADLKGFKEEQVKERQTAAEQQNYQADVSAVSERITVDAEAYPFLAAYGAEKAAAHAVNTWYAKNQAGQHPDLIEILESLESDLVSDFERLSAARKPPQPSLSAQAKGAPGRVNGAEQSAKHVAESNGKPPPATITNRNAAERASPDRKLTQEQRLKLAASRLVVRD